MFWRHFLSPSVLFGGTAFLPFLFTRATKQPLVSPETDSTTLLAQIYLRASLHLMKAVESGNLLLMNLEYI